MNRSVEILTLVVGLLVIVTLIPFRLPYAQAFLYYKYVDKNGNIHFADNINSIPENYRNQIKVYGKKETPRPVPSEKEQVTAKKFDQLSKVEEKKEAEKKSLQEKLAQEEKLREEKLKDQQEIQDRIAKSQEEIRAKQEEMGSLRPLWVWERKRRNQLNTEITSQEEEIKRLQEELAYKEEQE